MMRMLKKIAGWSWKKKIIGIICMMLILVLGMAGAVFGYAASKVNKIQKIEVKKETLKESITEEVEHKSGYLNVAVFGLDSRDGSLDKGNRSDTIMIASLNNDTKEVKLVSIYRDTLLELDDGSYNKANSAYSFGGPEGAVSLINRNLDMNIEKYVTVNFNALVDVIDAVGGLDLELTHEEVVHMNNYCVETSEITGKKYKKIEPEVAGTYHLNGVQAVSYSRIRYTEGGDFQRTSRQRLVIEKIAEKAKKADLSTINKIIDAVFPEITTSFTSGEIVKMSAGLLQYSIGDNEGFPMDNETPDSIPGYQGSYVVPKGLEENVIKLHKFLFPDEDYTPTDTVKEISDHIKDVTGIYPDDSEDSTEDNGE